MILSHAALERREVRCITVDANLQPFPSGRSSHPLWSQPPLQPLVTAAGQNQGRHPLPPAVGRPRWREASGIDDGKRRRSGWFLNGDLNCVCAIAFEYSLSPWGS